MKLADKIKSEATITLVCSQEDMRLRGNCLASGDDAADEACAVEIERQLDGGNEWAWCAVEVKAEWNGLEASDYLGGCSYASREDFIKNSGYYDDMVDTAIEEIADQALKIAAEASA